MHPFLQQLLQGQAVEWRALGEIAFFYGGLTGKSKHDFENGNAKYITYKNIFSNLEIQPDNLEMVKISDNERQHQVKYGDILFTGSSEIPEEVAMSSAVTTKFDEPIYLNSLSFGIRFNDDIQITPEFAKYLFRSNIIRREIIRTANGVTRFNVSKERFKKIQIPIPPLSVQSQIVQILDTFTELTAELSMRRKQYQYYRDFLLSEHELAKVGFEWKSLGEVAAKISSGGTPKTGMDEYYNGDIPWLRTQEVNFGEIWIRVLKSLKQALKILVQNGYLKIV
ncbi:Type I restriction enzyme specificity protein MPN_089 [Suttonella indologenes]|uniref:Type I restriction enzyme specificity protein MPN_089 n=1 Tax=Suttonella indologenes TaxID=13276 RepID=A0A380MXV2_9GAMM|nr:restriction endonuclease subunit S [Suttonella indologenes]SUO97112.1 Type I restriction enzyme specificity protein MPN_089 [Suttonella indologenes]